MGDIVPLPTAAPEPPHRPDEFRREGLGYVFEPKGQQVKLRADFLKRHSEELHGVLTVESTMPGVPQHLHEATHNFSSLNARLTTAKALAERAADVPWRDLLEQFCVGVMRREREGTPFIELSGEMEKPREFDQIERVVPWRAPTWLYGEGGSCKGLIATALAICVATGTPFLGLRVRQANVAYLDWEDDHDEMVDRLGQLCRGLGIARPQFYWRSCRRGGALKNQTHQIAKEFAQLGIGFYVIDSVGLAAGLGSERGGSEETALALFEAMGVIDATPLCIDHVSKSTAGNTGSAAKAYGSIYKENLCRHAWEVRKDQEEGSAEAHVGLFNRKTNRGTLQKPIGIHLTWDDNRVALSREDVRESATLSQTVSLRQRMIHLFQVAREPLVPEEVADRLGVDVGRVRTELSPSRSRGIFMRHPEAQNFWVLVEHEAVS